MNNNIQKLYDKSFVRDDYVNVGPDGPSMEFRFNPDKFAKLIVQECIAMCDEAREKYFDAQVRTDNFSEKNIHASGGVACKNIREQIAEHFGV
jgi:hypothetical protein